MTMGVHGIMITPEKMLVKTVHNRLETLPQENQDRFIVVDSVPEKVQMRGKGAKRYINPKTKEQWVEYEDRALTVEESAEDQVTAVKEQTTKLSELSTKLDRLITLQTAANDLAKGV